MKYRKAYWSRRWDQPRQYYLDPGVSRNIAIECTLETKPSNHYISSTGAFVGVVEAHVWEKSKMQKNQSNWIVNFIWGIADEVLRDLIMPYLMNRVLV